VAALPLRQRWKLPTRGTADGGGGCLFYGTVSLRCRRRRRRRRRRRGRRGRGGRPVECTAGAGREECRVHPRDAPVRRSNASRACDSGGMGLPVAATSRRVCWAPSKPCARGPVVHFTHSIVSNQHNLRSEDGDGPPSTLGRECRHRVDAFDV